MLKGRDGSTVRAAGPPTNNNCQSFDRKALLRMVCASGDLIHMTTNREPSELEMVQQTHRALDMLTGRWGIDVLYLLAGGRRRYSEVYYEVGAISKKALTSTLRRLERDELVARHVCDDSPLRVEYSLTPLGWSITQPLMALYEWAEDNLDADGKAKPERHLAVAA
jgi:DNA-binding HxlR family transcriptional regulator